MDEFEPVGLDELMSEPSDEVVPAERLALFIEENAAAYKTRRIVSRLVWKDTNGIVCIKAFGRDDYYWIEPGRYETAAEMYEWLQHLKSKRWATPEILWDVLAMFGRPE